MPAFLYFLPGHTAKPSAPDLAAAGLAYAFDGPPHARHVAHGPDDRPGVVLAQADQVDLLDVGFWPDRQTWQKHLAAPGAWIGRVAGDPPPGPADLARPQQLQGHLVTMADGGRWLAPVARGLADQEGTLAYYVALPQASTLDETGQWTAGDVLPRWGPLWAAALDWWDAKGGATVTDAEDGGARAVLDFSAAHEAAALALGANYRIGPAEASTLGLFTPAAVRQVLDALVDWPTLVRWTEDRKKKDSPPTPAASSAPAGPPASAPDTGPRLPTSGPSPSACSPPTP